MAASTRSIHSRQRAAGGKSASSTSRLSSPLRRRRRAAALIGRTAGTSGRPENSRAAPSATSRSNSRRAARPVIGAWRAASAGETQSSASSMSTILAAGFERSLGATAIRVLERRERSAARSRAEAAASAIAPAAAFGQAGSPGLGRRPAPSDRRVGSRIFVAIIGTGRGQRSRMARTRSNTQRARISASAVGASGKAENTGAALLPAAETGSPSPAQPSGWPRGRSGPRPGRAAPPRRRTGRGRGWAGGRRGRARAEGASRPGRRRRRRSAGRAARLHRR